MLCDFPLDYEGIFSMKLSDLDCFLDALSLRSDGISSIKIISLPGLIHHTKHGLPSVIQESVFVFRCVSKVVGREFEGVSKLSLVELRFFFFFITLEPRVE